MKVLITGAFGFFGRNIAFQFKKSGFEVVGMGHGKWHSDEFRKWGIDQWFETTITIQALSNININFDIIIHCAGSGSVGFSYDKPFEDFQKSVDSTLALLEYIRLQNPKCKFIYPSSPAVQGNIGDIPIEERMNALPISPYGFHKKIAEDLCLSYYKNFHISISVIRFFSIYGPGLQKQFLWDACQKIHQYDEVIFFGTGNETRDWIHVTDATSLILAVSKNFDGYHVINGGSGAATKIKDVVFLLSECMNKNVKVSFNGQAKVGDPKYFLADTTKAFSIGWMPNIKIEDGIKEYVGYFSSLSS